jgi:hypothetical protein
MTEHKVVGREKWPAARDGFPAREEDHTRRGDQLLAYLSMCRRHGALRRLFR